MVEFEENGREIKVESGESESKEQEEDRKVIGDDIKPEIEKPAGPEAEELPATTTADPAEAAGTQPLAEATMEDKN